MTEQNPTPSLAWLEEARRDVPQWASLLVRDADGAVIDWEWVASLDLAGGIGAAAAVDIPAAAAAGPAASGLDLHALLRQDYAIRNRLEAVLERAVQTFMCDFDRVLRSFRLPRALAYANRRLNDEIGCLIELGAEWGLWTVRQERRQFATVPVLQAAADADVADIQDDTDRIAEARKSRGAREREQREGAAQLAAQGSLSGIERGVMDEREKAKRPDVAHDWRNAYLPGRDVGIVMGIDLETTGISPWRSYIIDAGFEYIDVAAPEGSGASDGRRRTALYGEDGYDAGDAFGQARLSFGVPARAAWLGNAFIRELTGIDVAERAVGERYPAFDEWPAAQHALLRRLSEQPYVAHNASFEHKYFMFNVEGYAERYRDGGITIIDTLPMSRQWDPGSQPSDEHPYGDNTLEAYARRQGALGAGMSERHLGLEDAHIMLVAMKHHLASLKERGEGPWGPDGHGGTGGKRCRPHW